MAHDDLVATLGKLSAERAKILGLKCKADLSGAAGKAAAKTPKAQAGAEKLKAKVCHRQADAAACLLSHCYACSTSVIIPELRTRVRSMATLRVKQQLYMFCVRHPHGHAADPGGGHIDEESGEDTAW